MAKEVYIGTSGWEYPHWRETFYPEGVPATQHLAYYSGRLRTVELNNSFYRLPSPESVKKWRDATPEGFRFAFKASRYLTHMKKLKDAGEALPTLLQRASILEEKLGPILFQLPPGWKPNPERLSAFLKSLPKGHQYVFEFRQHDWYTPQTYALLREHNCAFCIYELDGHLSPLKVTADFVYIRLHGPGGKYQGSYPDATLRRWAGRCRAWSADREVWCYFDNDEKGYAVANAIRLGEMLRQE